MNIFTKSWHALKWIIGCLDYFIFGKDDKKSCCETKPECAPECVPECAPEPVVEKPKRRRRKKK